MAGASLDEAVMRVIAIDRDRKSTLDVSSLLN